MSAPPLIDVPTVDVVMERVWQILQEEM